MLRINPNGDRAVVDQSYLHVGTKTTRFNHTGCPLTHRRNKRFIKRNSLFGTGSTNVGRTIAFAGRGMQGKLTDNQNIGPDILSRTVHNAGLVIENAKF